MRPWTTRADFVVRRSDPLEDTSLFAASAMAVLVAGPSFLHKYRCVAGSVFAPRMGNGIPTGAESSGESIGPAARTIPEKFPVRTTSAGTEELYERYGPTMQQVLKRMMATIAGDATRTFGLAGSAIARNMRRCAHFGFESAHVVTASSQEASALFRRDGTSEREGSSHGGSANRSAHPKFGNRPERIMYHYTSDEGLKEILRSGKLRPSRRGLDDPPGQFLTTIEPGTRSDVDLADILGLGVRLSHYIAIDVAHLPKRKIVDMGDSTNYLIRNRRSLRIDRLVVDAGENPVFLP